MCGIIGAVNCPIDIETGLAALHHSGPDAKGTIKGKNFTLGHTRLSIIDTTDASNQPFRFGKTAIVYNGELWNYRELKSELACKFKTQGDTEVVAAALDRWGEHALDKMQGMFAVAWTDGKTVKVARDRFGEVPVYVEHINDGWIFASEKQEIWS